MKAIGKFFLISFLFFTYQVGISHASVTPNPSILPEILKQDCGFANDPYRDKCCGVIDFQEKIVDPIDGIVKNVTGAPSTGEVSDLLMQAHDADPVGDRTAVKCYTGSDKIVKVRNVDTGAMVNKCICSAEEFEKQNKQVDSVELEKICKKYERNSKELDACLACAASDRLMTGLGCIPTKISDFITNFLLNVGIGFAGMFSLGCVIYSAIMIQVSQGNAEKISQAQDQIKACVFGLLMVMFSILLLRIIGVDIIGIPGFL